jgi:hypothetical protein
MNSGDFRKTSTSLVFLLMLALAQVCAANDEPAGKEHWAETVEAQPIDLGSEQGDAIDASEEVRKISKYVQALKSDVIELNHDLRLMEEQLLFPSSTKYTIFVSLSSEHFFTLESIKLKLDGKLVATHLYSEKQRQAMVRGGVHRMYVTNLNKGAHSATAFFTGIGPSGRDYKRAVNIEFEKGAVGKYLELAIGDDASRQEPVFAIKQW